MKSSQVIQLWFQLNHDLDFPMTDKIMNIFILQMLVRFDIFGFFSFRKWFTIINKCADLHIDSIA